MAIVLSLISALAFGVGDFLGALSSRNLDSRLIGAVSQVFVVLFAVIAVMLDGTGGLTGGVLGWGALGGLGSGLGILSLYRGLSRGSVSVVAPVSGVITTLLPAVVGIALGDRLRTLEGIGVVLTLPAVALVSREDPGEEASSSGLLDGIAAGIGFGLLFVALDRAGSHHGAWPLLVSASVALVIMAPIAWRARSSVTSLSLRPLAVAPVIGILGGGANLLYLIALRHGELAIVGVLSSLYPAGTVLMARVWLHERWNRVQITGMAAAVVAVVMIVD